MQKYITHVSLVHSPSHISEGRVVVYARDAKEAKKKALKLFRDAWIRNLYNGKSNVQILEVRDE